jgi:hypothetical protein
MAIDVGVEAFDALPAIADTGRPATTPTGRLCTCASVPKKPVRIPRYGRRSARSQNVPIIITYRPTRAGVRN